MIDSVERAAAAALDFTKANVTSGTPWRGVGDFPRKLEGGHPYTGVNIPALLGQLIDPSSPAIFGSVGQWGNTGQKVAKGSKGLGFIYMKSFKKTDKTTSDLKEKGEDLEVTENGRVLVPYASFAAFAQCQTDGYDASAHHPVLEALNRLRMDDAALVECGCNARDAAERYMDNWMQTANAHIRHMSEGERCFIVHLASDLVVGFNAGSMAVAGELNPAYPEMAKDAVRAMVGRHIMRPWGIACDILRQLSPVFDANVKAGLDAAKLKQEEYKKKFEKPVRVTKTTVIEAVKPNGASDVAPEVVNTAVPNVILELDVIAPIPVVKNIVLIPVMEEPEAVDFSSNW